MTDTAALPARAASAAASASDAASEAPGAPHPERRVFIKTYGCQMNVYDSERMGDLLAPLGYARSDTPDGADLVILNTCHIREKATEKVYSELGKLKLQKAARGGEMTIAVAGCVAQAEGAEIMRRQPAVDLVLGPQSYHRLPELIARAHRGTGQALATEFETQEKFDALPETRAPDGPSAFLSVQEGCDKFCTFCVVPYTRGAEISRSVDAVTAEARGLAARGVRELVLLGQNVNAYHGAPPALSGEEGEWGLGRLVRHLALIGGIARIRYTTSHPRDMDADLIAAHGDTPAMMPYLHLPVQSGSDRILGAMNRGHTAEHYLHIMREVRARRPDIALASDFIVGFPGEREDDFRATMELVEAVGYSSGYSFKYSARPGTPAAALPGQVGDAVATRRLHELQALQREQQEGFNAAQVGRVLPVLVAGEGRFAGQMKGRSPYNQSVWFEGPERLKGQIVPVRITQATLNALGGELAEGALEGEAAASGAAA